MPTPKIIRCSVPDCDWGFELSNSDRMEQCYEAYRLHCVEMHGIRADSKSFMQFDLEKLMLSMFQE
jgi:hypothetical protein